jgi:aminomuconate-semialdehyde/2-hydroxymuconate-6-semialdehyde dehydrogenase
MKKILNFIGGQYIESSSGDWLDNTNPATGEVYSQITNSNEQDVKDAINAAKKVKDLWARTPVEERATILRKMASLIKDQASELAMMETIDNGKPISVSSTVDIPRASTNLEFFADAISQYSNESYQADGVLNYTKKIPLGIVTCISPWNLPLYLFTWKIAPAIAAGNCVIAKPSEVTPMTASLMGEIANQAGLPAGVLNILHGQGHRMGEELVANKEIKAVSFTGSTATGKVISKLAGEHLKKCSLEMGGKNPNIIFDDCDYKKTLNVTLASSFANQGQICLCGSRIFIHENIYEQFKNDLVAKAIALAEKQGDPQDPKTRQGSLVSEEHFNKVMSCLALAKEEGASILCGGKRFGDKGFFIVPTVMENLSHDCRTNQEEIFGPVVTLTPFKDEDDVINMANSTPYGLSASVWTQDIDRAHRVADKIDSGIVWINAWMLRDLRIPFGGMKESGMGREGGHYSLDFFTEKKNICLKYSMESL